MAVDSAATPAIDAERFNRQLYAVGGHVAQSRIQASKVLIAGLRGVGVEVAKNLVLMGVGRVELFDREATTSLDLSGNFYLTPADIGAPRAARCVAKIAELNHYAQCVEAPESEVTADVLSRFDVVVAADQSEAELRRLGMLARAAGKIFIAAEGRGAFGRIFSDFGANFFVEEVNDEPPTSGIIETIATDKSGIVTLLEGHRHGLETGDFVTFSEIKLKEDAAAPSGATVCECLQGAPVSRLELNNCAPREVRVISPSAFSVGHLCAVRGAHVGGGLFKQVKQPRTVTFASIDTMLRPVGEEGGPTEADFIGTDWGKLDRAPAYHAAFAALHGAPSFPPPGDEAAARALVEATRSRLPAGALTPALEGVVLQFSRAAHGHLSPLCAALGGIAAQEAIKAVSYKFMPIRQWLYLDAAEALPPADAPLPPSDVAPTGSRYDGQIVCLGRAFQARLGALRYFLVGAGAIGCEILKNWAAMGVGAESGMVYVTDMDRIEKSNLSRQFLFREGDIGKHKSVASIHAASRLNLDFRAQAFERAVGDATESIFDDNFWMSLSGVCTALDNIQARLYVDGRCVHYGLPMLESGTLGTKGNTQIVVPRLTENYGATRDPPERAIPVCTLKDFPYQIEHTLQWARDWFEGEFKQIPEAVNAYASQSDFLEQLAKQASSQIETLQKIKDALVTSRPAMLEDCVAWARLHFSAMFRDRIEQLLYNFPSGHTLPNGALFWTGTKREPAPVYFSAADPLHLEFIMTATKLRGSLYGLHVDPAVHTHEWFAQVVNKVHVPKFNPASGVVIAATEKEAEELKTKAAEGGAGDGAGGGAAGGGADSWDVGARASELATTLPPQSSLAGFRCSPVFFEKDDDLHISFVTACSNLRARVYRIEEKNKHDCKLIVGKIIPAIATTTAVVSGLISLELYKLVANRPIEDFRSSFLNLAIPAVSQGEPIGVKKTKLLLTGSFSPPPEPGSSALSAATTLADGKREWSHSIWDRIDIAGPMTLAQLIEHVQSNFGLEIHMVSYGAAMLYMKFSPPSRKRERLPMELSALAEKVSQVPILPHASFISLQVTADSVDGDEPIELPIFRYQLPRQQDVFGRSSLNAQQAISAATPAASK